MSWIKSKYTLNIEEGEMKNEKMNSNSQDETSAKLTKVLVSIYENILYPTGKCMITKTEQKLTVVRMLRMRLMCHKI